MLEKQISSLILTKGKYENLLQENQNLNDKLTETIFQLERLKNLSINNNFHDKYIQTDELDAKEEITSTFEPISKSELKIENVLADNLGKVQNIVYRSKLIYNVLNRNTIYLYKAKN